MSWINAVKLCSPVRLHDTIGWYLCQKLKLLRISAVLKYLHAVFLIVCKVFFTVDITKKNNPANAILIDKYLSLRKNITLC